MFKTSVAMLLFTTAMAACNERAAPTATGAQEPPVSSASAPAAAGVSASPSGLVTLVRDRSLVCMVNDQFMGRAQIPTVVNGNTYYGCCPACKERLTKEASVRTSVDPVSKKPVDKALASIGQTANGSVLYFENERNLATYSASKSN
jgi:YHS domain-containing protein